jgi:glycosyltransferase involved in cell wall biosynthesis
VDPRRSAILVTSPPGQLTCAELARQAAADERPRKDYVELAARLDADVIDSHWMSERAYPVARAVSARIGMSAGQVLESFLRRSQYRDVLAWADRLGLPLALLLKLTRSKRDLALVSVWLSRSKKAVFLRRFKVHTHVSAIIGQTAQADIAHNRLGVPASKLYAEPWPVDDRFWRPSTVSSPRLIAAAGLEARDYRSLLRAIQGEDLELEMAVGSIALPEMAGEGGEVHRAIADIHAEGLPSNAHAAERNPRQLRELYARSQVVVVPLHDVEFDAGVTAVTEAMAMGNAVIASRTRGLRDLFVDGEQGLYVPPHDPRALREAIIHLLETPGEAQRMGRAGRALVERRHRLDPCLDRLAAIVRGEAVPRAVQATTASPFHEDGGSVNLSGS